MKREFYDKTIYTLTNYFVSFLQASLYFAISNIFLIAYFIFTLINPNIFNLFRIYCSLLGHYYNRIKKDKIFFYFYLEY